MNRRIFGYEHELGSFAIDQNKRKLTVDQISKDLFHELVEMRISHTDVPGAANLWVENGARLYSDTGFHPETSTAEAESIDEANLNDLANEAIAHRAAQNAQERKTRDGEKVTYYLIKNNVDNVGNSYGCHENFLFSRDVKLDTLVRALLTFFVSRQVMAGTGNYAQAVKGGYDFRISQRAEHMVHESSGATTSSRGIFNTRDEPHADAERYRRLHVIVGDSNMSCFANKYLKTGPTAVVLDLIEAGAFDLILNTLDLEKPVEAIRTISRDPTLKEPVKMKDGRELNGVELQNLFLEIAKKPQNERMIEPENRMYIPVWEEILRRLEKDPELTYGMVEWVTKRELAEKHRIQLGQSPGEYRYSLVDLKYHDINPQRGLFRRLQQLTENKTVFNPHDGIPAGKLDRLLFGVDHSLIPEYKQYPPTGRALVRGTLIAIGRILGWELETDWLYFKIAKHKAIIQDSNVLMMKDPRNLSKDDISSYVDRWISPSERAIPQVAKRLEYMFANLN